jgi:hypothetical protein
VLDDEFDAPPDGAPGDLQFGVLVEVVPNDSFDLSKIQKIAGELSGDNVPDELVDGFH